MDHEGNLDRSNIRAEDNSVAARNISVGGSVDGSFIIGSHNVVGYTSDQVSALLTQISATFQPKPFDGRSPYKGLDVFEEEDAELFFGREKLVDDLVVRVKESRTVFVTGPSGSGKSSLVRAGLIHTLKQGMIPNSDRWLYATIKPGRDPFEAVAGAFSRLKSPELGDYFLQNASQPEVLHKCAESTLSERSDQRLVLFVDQFEEIFTQIHKDKVQAFVELLANATDAENGRVILLFSMRSDFIPNCVIYPKLNALLNRQFVQIGAMQEDELVSAIAQPALRVGLRINPDLIAQIINDMHGESGALPLMQFALKDLFDAQHAKDGLIALTLSDYLERGGIRKALERHADNSFSKLNGHERKLTRAIFGSLIEIGRGTQDTCRTAIFDELVPASARGEEVEAIVRKLADARLLTTDEVAGKDTVTISHEKLIDAWPWLKKLVNENRDVIAARNEIARDATEWNNHGRDPSYLYSGARLGVAQEQLSANRVLLSGLSKDFIEEGIALREAERKAKELLRRRIVIGLVAGTVIALALAVFGFYQSNVAFYQSNVAKTAQADAEAKSRRAIAGQLASESKNVLDKYPQRALLLALESIRISRTANEAVLTEAEEALRLAYQRVSGIGLAGFAYEPTYVQFTQNGKWLAAGTVGGVKGEAHIWNVAKAINDLNYQPFVISFPMPENESSRVYLSPHDVWFVADSQSKGTSIWKTDVENEERVPILFEGIIKFIGAQDDSLAIEQQPSRIITWRLDDKSRTKKEIQSLDGKFLAASVDGRYIVVDNPEQGLQVWDMSAWAEPLLKVKEKDSVYKSAFFDSHNRWLVLIDETTHPEIQASVYNSDKREREMQVWRSNNILVYSLANLSAPPFSFALNGAAAKLPIISPDGLGFISFLSFPPLKNGASASSTKVGYLNLRNEIPEYKIFDNEISEYQIFDIAMLTPSSINNDWMFFDEFLLDLRDSILFTNPQFAYVDRESNGNVIFSPDRKYILMGDTQMSLEELDKSHHVVLEPKPPDQIAPASPAQFAQLLKDNPKALGLEAGVAVYAVSTDNHWVAAGTRDGSMRLWNNLAPWDAVKIRPENYPSYIALSNDNHWMALGGSLWQLEEGKPVRSYIIDEKPDTTISISTFSPDSRWLLSLTDKYDAKEYTNDVRAVLIDLGQVSVQGISQNQEIGSFLFKDTGSGVAIQFSADNRWVAVYQNDAFSLDNEVNIASTSSFLYDLVNRKSYPLTSDLYQVEFMSDNQHIALSSGSYDNQGSFIGKNPEIWSLPTADGELTKVGEVNGTGRPLISNDGHWLVMFPEDSKTNQSEQLWDLLCAIENKKCEPQFLGANRAVFSPDATYLLTGLADGKNLVYDVWDLKSNPPSKIYPNHSTFSSKPEVSKTAQWIIFGDSISSGGNAGFLSDPNYGDTTFDGYASTYFGGGRGGSGDIPLRSYHIDYFVTALNAAHAQDFILRGHESGVSEIQISPNEQYVLTFSGDIYGDGAPEQALRLWDMNAKQSDPNGRAVVLPWSSGFLAEFAFSPNSEWIYVVGDRDHGSVLYYYPKSIEQLQAQACKAVGRNFIINEWERYFPKQEYRRTCENLPAHPSVNLTTPATP